MITATDTVLNEVNTSAPWSLIEEFSGSPRWKPEDVNSAGERLAVILLGLGIPVCVYEPSLYLSIPYEASVNCVGQTFRAKPPSYSKSVPEGIAAPLIHVPASYSGSVSALFSATEGPIEDGAVAGKIVVTEGYGLPHKISEMQEAGAIGVITINPGDDIHWAICTPIWGTPGLNDLPRKPRIPVVSVNRPDGKQLTEAAQSGQQVTIRTKLDEGWFNQKIVVAEVPGVSDPDSFVLMHGHYDSWDVGVGDNATGDATLLEIARVLWLQRSQLKRSVRIAWWPGHSTGRYAGSTWYADNFALELNDRCVAQVNCDSPGCRWATEFNHLSLTPETGSYVQSVIRDVTGLPCQGERAPRAGDWSFNNIGISGFFMLSSTMPDSQRAEKGYYAVGGCGGNIAWHTENDTLAIADKDILLRDIQVYLAAVWGVANSVILPFDWRAATTEMDATLERYQQSCGEQFDLEPAHNALRSLVKRLDAFYDAISNGAIEPAAANTAIRRLARILIPVDHARELRFFHDPALPVPSLPALSVASAVPKLPPEMLGFALTELRRGQNLVIDAFRRAEELVSMPNFVK
jgi:hypothetical protein